MFRIYWKIIGLAALVLGCCGCRKNEPQRLLLGGSGWNKLVMIDRNSHAIVWEHPLEAGSECNSVAYTPEGHILYAYSKGARLITEDHRELWHVSAPPGAELQTAEVLSGDRYLLAWCGHPAVILEVDRNGGVISRTEYETGIERPHSQFRRVTKNSRGNYLMPLFATSEVREISPEGRLVRSVPVGGNPFKAVELPDGRWLVSGGDRHFYQEIDGATGEVLRRVNSGDLAGIPFFFVADLLPLPDGGLYICNWQGHGGRKAQESVPGLIRVDKAGNCVWTLDGPDFRLISAVCEVN